MAKDSGTAQRKKRDLERKRKELSELEARYDKARELLEKSGGGLDRSRMKGAKALLSKIDKLKKEIKDTGGSVPTSRSRPDRAPPLEDSGKVRPAPYVRSAREGKELASRAEERRFGSGERRPSTVNTKSKKPIAKRLMEALGDKRTMEQATRDREENERMERETMGRKKGGMGQKKKAPVKKACGGTVKKKQGGSANKVNMKAGFTRRGCSKG